MVRLDGTRLQIVTATAPPAYPDAIINHKQPLQRLLISRSGQYELLDREGRKDALTHLWRLLDFIDHMYDESAQAVL